MTYAFGGPEEYHGRDMWKAHEKLVRNKGLNDHHFDVIVKHLVGALQKFNVPEVSQSAGARLANAKPMCNCKSARLAFCNSLQAFVQ